MKPILIHPSLNKHSFLKLLFLLTLFFLVSLLSLITNIHPDPTTPASPLPKPLVTALLHYAAAANSTAAIHFSSVALNSVAAVLRNQHPLNLLVFGLSHETFLWKTLNLEGRTVFIDESTFMVTKLEEKHPEIEAYDITFSPKNPTKLQNLIKYVKKRSRKECRPVQNLLYSDCLLAITDMPNFVYDMAWDMILVNGPVGTLGRVSTIFTAGVLARSKGCDGGTHVFVHEFDREVERVCSGEFLCKENLVEEKGGLGHFVLGEMGDGKYGFCKNKTISLLSND